MSPHTNAHNGNAGPSQQLVTFISSDRAVDVTLKFGQEGQVHTVECVELGTAMFGDTYREAEEAILEAIALQLEALEEHGELERFLLDHGVPIRTPGPEWFPARRERVA